jgi:hypothetical protein
MNCGNGGKRNVTDATKLSLHESIIVLSATDAYFRWTTIVPG